MFEKRQAEKNRRRKKKKKKKKKVVKYPGGKRKKGQHKSKAMKVRRFPQAGRLSCAHCISTEASQALRHGHLSLSQVHAAFARRVNVERSVHFRSARGRNAA